MRGTRTLGFMVVALVVLAIPGVVGAADKPEDIVSYRHTVMEAAGKHMKASSMIAKGQAARPQDMLGHAQALQAMSVDLAALFPAGTGPDKLETDSKAEVWTKPDEFKKAIEAYAAETAKLVDVARGGDVKAFGEQLGAVGRTCGGCHDTFRVDEDK